MAIIAPILLIVYACWKFAGGLQTTYTASNGLTCYLCSAGTYFIKDCSFDFETAVCSPCPSGTFSPDYNRARYCQLCSTVCRNTNYETENQPELKTAECTSTSDIKCECRPGLFRESGYHGMCRTFTKCPVGYGVAVPGTGNSDTVCKPCEPSQTFSNTTSANDPCRLCTKCDGRFIVQSECTPDQDTACVPLMLQGMPVPNDENGKLSIGLSIGIPVTLVVVICGVCLKARRRKKRNSANNTLIHGDIEQKSANETLIPNGIEQSHIATNFVPNCMHQPRVEPVYVELSNCIPPGEFKMFFRNIGIAEDIITRVTMEHPFKIKEQCYQLLLEWGRLQQVDLDMSDLEWSMELCRLLKSDIDAIEDMPNDTKEKLFAVLDRRSYDFGQQLPRNGRGDSLV